MSDQSTLQGVLRSIPQVAFILPTRRLYSAVMFHATGRATIAGDAAKRTYAGWPLDASAFDDAGRWRERYQTVHIGDDMAAGERLREALVDHGYAVSRIELGQNAERRFHVAPDAAPATVSSTESTAWTVRLRALSLLPSPVPLRTGEEEMLHRIVALREFGRLRAGAALALDQRGLLDRSDIDVILTDGTMTGRIVSTVLTRALADGDPRARAVALRLVDEGRASPELRAQLSPTDERERLHASVSSGGIDDVPRWIELVAASGEDPVSAIADAIVASPGNRAENTLATHLAARAEAGPAGPLRVLRSALPLASRLAVARRFDVWGHRLEQQRRSDRVWPERVLTEGEVRQRDELIEAWDDAVDALHAEAGLAPHSGLSARCSDDDAENVEHLVERHADGLRALIADDSGDITGLTAALAILAARDALRLADIEPLLTPHGRGRLLLPHPGVFAFGAPASAIVARLLWRLDDARADQLAKAVRRDKRVKMAYVRAMVVAVGPGGSTEVLTIPRRKLSDGTYDEHGDMRARLVAHAESTGGDIFAAVTSLWDDVDPDDPHARRHLARHIVVAHAYGSTLLGSLSVPTRSPRIFEAALDIAETEHLPADLRIHAMDVARSSTVLQPPRGAGTGAPDPDRIPLLRDRYATLNRRLGTRRPRAR